jgi:hypothetical protein
MGDLFPFNRALQDWPPFVQSLFLARLKEPLTKSPDNWFVIADVSREMDEKSPFHLGLHARERLKTDQVLAESSVLRTLLAFHATNLYFPRFSVYSARSPGGPHLGRCGRQAGLRAMQIRSC